MIKLCAKNNTNNDWVLGGGWAVDNFTANTLPDKKLLDHVNYHDMGHFKSSIAKKVIALKNKTFVRVFVDELKKHQGTCDLMN